MDKLIATMSLIDTIRNFEDKEYVIALLMTYLDTDELVEAKEILLDELEDNNNEEN